jgi:hypothetical protein
MPFLFSEKTRFHSPSAFSNLMPYRTMMCVATLQQEVAPLTSGRLSHSSGPLNGGGSLSDSPPVSPEIDDAKVRPCLVTFLLLLP